MSLLIKNGRVIDPANNFDGAADVFVSNGVVESVGRGTARSAETVIDASGCWVAPGLVDLHVHLREPGYEHKETIRDGSRAAAKGGFTTICCMPNTDPAIDSPETVGYILAKSGGHAKVLPIASITLGQKGECLTDMPRLKAAGVCGFSEDGKSVANTLLMKKAFERAALLNLPIFDHCEDPTLVGGGAINEGEAAKRLSLPGMPSIAEDVATARDLLLAESAKAKIHLCHVSTARGARLLKEAQLNGVNATGEACPHHFCLCDEDILSDDGMYKMNPPLRSRADMEAMRQALASGIIGVIATDHAPHGEAEKSGGFMKAAFGITGLETAVALCITTLVNGGVLAPFQLIEKMTINPAKVLGINAGSLSIGAPADIAIIDPAQEWRVDPAKFYSKGKNTPFAGKTLSGVVKYTIVNGGIVYGN